MNQEFQKLLELAYSDGVLTEAENVLLLKKAKQLGMDEIEAELIIANYQPEQKSASSTDNYDISNEELIQRLTNYCKHLRSATAQIQLDPFPMLIDKSNKMSSGISAGRKVLAEVLKGDIISESLSVAGKVTRIPGAKLGGKLVGKGISGLAKKVVGVETKKLNQAEVIALVESYLVILEMRKGQSELLSSKYEDFSQQATMAKENPIKKKGLFR